MATRAGCCAGAAVRARASAALWRRGRARATAAACGGGRAGRRRPRRREGPAEGRRVEGRRVLPTPRGRPRASFREGLPCLELSLCLAFAAELAEARGRRRDTAPVYPHEGGLEAGPGARCRGRNGVERGRRGVPPRSPEDRPAERDARHARNGKGKKKSPICVHLGPRQPLLQLPAAGTKGRPQGRGRGPLKSPPRQISITHRPHCQIRAPRSGPRAGRGLPPALWRAWDQDQA